MQLKYILKYYFDSRSNLLVGRYSGEEIKNKFKFVFVRTAIDGS